MVIAVRRFFCLAAVVTAFSALPGDGHAQVYPARPVHVVVGFAAGGPGDALARIMGQWLQERLGQAALDILGAGGLLSEDADGAPVSGEMEQLLRHSIMGMIGGGTNEIQRNVIAQRGLDLPS